MTFSLEGSVEQGSIADSNKYEVLCDKRVVRDTCDNKKQCIASKMPVLTSLCDAQIHTLNCKSSRHECYLMASAVVIVLCRACYTCLEFA